MDKQNVIEIILWPYLVEGKEYHSPLPAELQEWYCYTCDGGHSIVCALAKDYQPGVDMTNYLVPVPVRTVLRGYEVRGDYIVVDLPYSEEIGLIAPPEDGEF